MKRIILSLLLCFSTLISAQINSRPHPIIAHLDKNLRASMKGIYDNFDSRVGNIYKDRSDISPFDSDFEIYYDKAQIELSECEEAQNFSALTAEGQKNYNYTLIQTKKRDFWNCGKKVVNHLKQSAEFLLIDLQL